jgi:CRISPR-associated Csx3 family protein
MHSSNHPVQLEVTTLTTDAPYQTLAINLPDPKHAIAPEVLPTLTLPSNLDLNREVILFGQAPAWLYGHLIHRCHSAAWMGCYDARSQQMERTGKTFDEVKDSVRGKGVFTTHTPVPAGHDAFSSEQIDHYFSHYCSQLGLSKQEFMALAKQPSEDDEDLFNMTVLALRLCKAANGVSKINGEVCRQMWSGLYPERSVDEVPIDYVTNGIHAHTWTAPLMSELYDQYLGEDWANREIDDRVWEKVDEIPDHEIWWRHQCLQERLIAFVRSHVQHTRRKRGDSDESIQEAEHLFDPNVLTIGFARRFSSYKRGNLIMHDPDRARAIICNSQRPVQIVFAGKAHPADEKSKQIMQQLIEWSHHPDLKNRIVFIEDYDMHVAEKLVQGVDVWLNNPLRPKEACGTSGQKASFNGVINCSILDGWWPEAYQTTVDGKGESGFSWAWLGAAMQATSLPFGVICAPGQRYHPAIVAQAAATLAEMFPNRLWVSLASGEALNERITGEHWPPKSERNARLKECVDIIRALWAGETVTHYGRVRVEEAKLYTRPEIPLRVIGAAVTAETAEWLGSWADGLYTISRPPEELKKVVEAFYRGGGEGKPMYLKVQISYARNDADLSILSKQKRSPSGQAALPVQKLRSPIFRVIQH